MQSRQPGQKNPRGMEQVRVECVQDGRQCESLAMTSMLSGITEKFAFLEQEPFIIWQAHDRRVAADIIRRRDSLVSEGGQPHRVIERFAGAHGGGGMGGGRSGRI